MILRQLLLVTQPTSLRIRSVREAYEKHSMVVWLLPNLLLTRLIHHNQVILILKKTTGVKLNYY